MSLGVDEKADIDILGVVKVQDQKFHVVGEDFDQLLVEKFDHVDGVINCLREIRHSACLQHKPQVEGVWPSPALHGGVTGVQGGVIVFILRVVMQEVRKQ